MAEISLKIVFSNCSPNFAADESHIMLCDDFAIRRALKSGIYLSGSYSVVAKEKNGSIFLCRDPYGFKNFFTFMKKKNILYVSSNFIKLGQEFSFCSIKSVPAGGYVCISSKNGYERVHVDSSAQSGRFELKYIENRLSDSLDFYTNNLNTRALVCLSGGIDSAIIASLRPTTL